MSLNPVLMVENPDEFLRDTVGHEWGHFATKTMHPRAGFHHGKQWQGILKTLGVPINIDHRYSVKTIIDETPATLDELKGLRVNRKTLEREELFYLQHVAQINAQPQM